MTWIGVLYSLNLSSARTSRVTAVSAGGSEACPAGPLAVSRSHSGVFSVTDTT